MKTYNNFILEEMSDKEFNSFRIKQRKLVSNLVDKFILNKLKHTTTGRVSIKPYLENTEIIIRCEGNYFSNTVSSKSFKNRLNDVLKSVNDFEEVCNELNIEFEVKQISNSSDFEVIFFIKTEFFESDLYKSLTSITKYNL